MFYLEADFVDNISGQHFQLGCTKNVGVKKIIFIMIIVC